MINRIYTLLVVLIILPYTLQGQGQQQSTSSQDEEYPEGICITMEMDSALRAANPALGTLAEMEEQLQKDISKYKDKLKRSRIAEEVLTIPVIVHVIHNDENLGQGANITAV